MLQVLRHCLNRLVHHQVRILDQVFLLHIKERVHIQLFVVQEVVFKALPTSLLKLFQSPFPFISEQVAPDMLLNSLGHLEPFCPTESLIFRSFNPS